MHYQAITTRYIGPTTYRPGRIKAQAAAGHITIEYDHALNQSANHAAAAMRLAERYGWSGQWVSGGLPDGRGDVFVIVAGYGDKSFDPAFVVAPRAKG